MGFNFIHIHSFYFLKWGLIMEDKHYFFKTDFKKLFDNHVLALSTPISRIYRQIFKHSFFFLPYFLTFLLPYC